MSMVFAAKVKGGALVVDPGIELPEGATVTVYLEDEEPANDESEPITPEEAGSLAASVVQADVRNSRRSRSSRHV